jgi:PIN domain nuclease of toxin-antitoxin system
VGCHEVILLDTNAAIWMTTGDISLGRHSRVLIAKAAADERLAISAISFWEIALLVTKRRLITDKTPSQLRRELLGSGVIEIPLTGDIAVLAVELAGLPSDPADRFIAATAIAHGAALMTADSALLRWPHTVERLDASA